MIKTSISSIINLDTTTKTMVKKDALYHNARSQTSNMEYQLS